MSSRYFQGTSVQGQVREHPAQSFREVVDTLKKPSRLTMTRKAFLALGKKERAEIKRTWGVPFFVPATFTASPSKRSYEHAIECNLLFLDIDELPDGTCPAAPFVENPELLKERLPFDFIAYTTASSTPEKPRMRVMVKADRIPVAEYPQAVATLASLLDLPAITSESKVAVQPMFNPVVFKDSPAGYSPIIVESKGCPAFTRADIQGRAPSGDNEIPTQSANGANGHHETPDELENLAPTDPDITIARAKEMLDVIDPDITYHDWIKIAAALRHQFSPHQEDEALALFTEWSEGGNKHEEGEPADKWRSLQQTTKGRHPVTIRSLVKLAEEHGWESPKTKAAKETDKHGYYDSAKKEFLVRNEGGRWLSHTAEGYKRYLRKLGHKVKIPEGKLLSEVEEIMEAAINKRDVKYAGPLAGRAAGFYEEGGARFLVTESPKIVRPVRGSAPIICGLIDSLVGQGEHGPRQKATAWGWLKTGYESLRAGERQDAQALALAGPVGCGKSLFQSVITELFGGRSAKAMRYMSGQTPFNSELFGAEHLMLEDESSSTDIRARMAMAAHIKEITVNGTHSCHAKHREAITLRPLWWMTISLNDEPEAMLVLPPMRDDIVGKIILLQCAAPLKPFPTGNHALHSKYWQSILAEIPAFAQMLLDYTIPDELRDTRFGIRYFHHPALIENLTSLAPETKLLELIDRAIFRERTTPWEGTAGDLESTLRGQFSGVQSEADRLLYWNTACGVYLGKLEHKGRVTQTRNSQRRLWVIQPPSVEIISSNLDDY